jgi:hypothetical protein
VEQPKTAVASPGTAIASRTLNASSRRSCVEPKRMFRRAQQLPAGSSAINTGNEFCLRELERSRMCRFALVGAQTDATSLRSMMGGREGELDTHVRPDPSAAASFPGSDTVLCVTSQGCSCALLEGVGLSHGSKRSVHFAGTGYVFRRALAAAALRFGGIRLLAHERSSSSVPPRVRCHRSATLAQFLRSGLEPDDGIVFITP